VFAEQWIPSGLAALFVTTSPFWLVGMESLAAGGEPLHGPTLRAMLIGTAGVAILVGPAFSDFAANEYVLIAFLVLQLGCAGWALGSIAQRNQKFQAHPFVLGAVQQFATGIAYSIPALLLPQHPIHWTTRGVGALAYLVVFGSIVGYSAYIYSMDRL